MRKNVWTLCLCLAGCGDSTARLIERAGDADPAVRLRAIHGLRYRAGDKDAVLPVLIKALDDESPEVRRDAARAISAFGAGAAAAVPALRQRLNDSEAKVRMAAEQTLRHVDPEARTRPAPP